MTTSAPRPFPPEACSILESMGDAFYALDGTWRAVYANQRALRFWNLPAERVIGQIIWDSLPQLIGTMNEAVLRQVKAEQRTISFEAPSPVTGAWVQVTVGPWADGVTVYWRDITERRRAAEALEAHEEHLRLAQEAGGTGTWEWDLTADSMIWSAQLFRTLGLEPEPGSESLARLLDLVNPPDRDWMAAQLAGFRVTPGRMRIEAPMRRPDGEIRWILFLGQVEADESGKPARMLGVTIDATMRRQTEEGFRADAERLRLAMRAGGLAAWEYDLKTNVRSWSLEAAAMIGRASNEMRLSGREWARMIHPDDAPRVWEQFSAAITGKGEYHSEYRVTRPDGDVRWTAVHGAVLLDATGIPTRVIGVVQDITERKRAAEQLHLLNEELEARVHQEVAAREAAQARAAHAERMQALGQLAGGIAHDFNNVLQAVAGGAHLIGRRPGDAEAAARFSRIILDAANRGSSITRRLLAFAHRGDLRAEPLDIRAILEGLRELLSHTLGAGIRIDIACAPDAPAIYADRGQLESVLVNLATNARDAMPQGGTLVFSASREPVAEGFAHAAGLRPGDYVRLAVMDTGCGMEPAVLARASEPFFSTKRKGEGTGLGLAMARGFAEQSGGGLTIQSAAGAGTTVTLYLPRAEEFAGSGVAATDTEPQTVVRAHVLLVEDDALVAETLAAQLQEAGFAVHTAADAAQALTILESGAAVDCMVTDLSMPGLNGLGLIGRAQKARPRLPAILLTGYAEDSAALAVSGAVSGSFSLLRKPVEVRQLCDRITLLLEGVRLV